MKTIPKMPDVEIELLYEITQGVEKGLLLFTAMEMGVFECLNQSKPAEEISRDLNTDLKLTTKFLNSLAAIGLIGKENSLYRNTAFASTYLIRDSSFYQGNLLDLLKKTRQERWAGLHQALKEGGIRTQAKPAAVFDKSFILAMAEGAMRGGLHAALGIVASLPEFKSASRLLDLGGGHGLYAIGFAQINSQLHGYIVDFPNVIGVAKEYIAEYEMSDRVDTICGDFTKDDFGGNYDIIFASDALYKPRELLLPVLDKIKAALTPQGIFISKHWSINEDKTAPVTTVLWDFMVSLSTGFPFYTYTDQEYVDVLREAGFKRTEIFDISTASKPSRIIVGRKTESDE